MDELAIGVMLLALLFGGGDDEDAGGGDDLIPAEPFCVPINGVPYVWNPATQKCVPAINIPGVVVPDPDEPPPPPKVPADWIRDDYPKSGRIFQVSPGWIFLGTGQKRIAFQAIADKAYTVAREHGQSHAEALAYASDRANVGSNRLAYFRGIQCEPFNDKLYATYGYGEQAMPAPSGRAIRLLPQHADNRARMINGQPLIRSIRLRTPNDQDKGNGTAAPGAPSGHFEALWLPEIDGEHLWLTGQVRTLGGGPPKVITDLGWDNRSGVIPASLQWGC